MTTIYSGDRGASADSRGANRQACWTSKEQGDPAPLNLQDWLAIVCAPVLWLGLLWYAGLLLRYGVMTARNCPAIW